MEKKQITLAEIEKFFGSVQEAIDFYEKGQAIQTQELLEVRTWKRYNVFSTDSIKLAINNARLSSLMDNFQAEYLKIIEDQVIERAKLITHIKTLNQ